MPIHRPARFQMYAMSMSHETADRFMLMYDEFETKLKELLIADKGFECMLFLSNNIFGITRRDIKLDQY